MKKLYLFDFDGTLTYKDTMFLFLKYYDSKKYFWSYFKHIPVFILVKLKLMDAELAKKSFIASVLKGEREIKINRKVLAFFDEYYPKIIRESALDFFKNIDKNNTTFYLVSASLDIWVRPFAKKMGMTLIATEAQFVEGRFTGDCKRRGGCSHWSVGVRKEHFSALPEPSRDDQPGTYRYRRRDAGVD